MSPSDATMPEPDRWWEPRRDGEPTNLFLARVLQQLGAPDLTAKALAYHFDDYFCPPDIDDGANMQRLVAAVRDWSRSASRAQREQGNAIVAAVWRGEFDGTRAESTAWAQSPDGRAAFAELVGQPPRDAR